MEWNKTLSEKIKKLALLKFLISFVYVILKSIKEPLVVLSKGSCVEILPVLKAYVVFPTSIFFMLFFGAITQKHPPSKVFFGLISFFLLFFIGYMLILPYADYFLPHEHAKKLLADYPQHRHWIALYRYWLYALGFTAMEMYGQVIIFVVFWGFSNDICNREEAKQYYPLLIGSGCVGGLFASEYVIWILNRTTSDAADVKEVAQPILLLSIFLLVAILIFYGILYREFYQNTPEKLSPISKKKISFMEAMRHILSNPSLLAISTMVIACALSINLLDVTYKANLKNLFPLKKDYQLFKTRIAEVVLFISGFITLFLRRQMGSVSWKKSSLVTPLTILLSGSLFFISSKFRVFFGFPLLWIVYLGVFQSLLSEIAKYAFFDSSKEVAYMALDRETRIKGKAAGDLIGSRAGKSLSGHVHTLILLFGSQSGNILDVTHILLICLWVTLGVWIYAINYLEKKEIKEKERQASLQAA